MVGLTPARRIDSISAPNNRTCYGSMKIPVARDRRAAQTSRKRCYLQEKNPMTTEKAGSYFIVWTFLILSLQPFPAHSFPPVLPLRFLSFFQHTPPPPLVPQGSVKRVFLSVVAEGKPRGKFLFPTRSVLQRVTGYWPRISFDYQDHPYLPP